MEGVEISNRGGKRLNWDKGGGVIFCILTVRPLVLGVCNSAVQLPPKSPLPSCFQSVASAVGGASAEIE